MRTKQQHYVTYLKNSGKCGRVIKAFNTEAEAVCFCVEMFIKKPFAAACQCDKKGNQI